MLKIGITGTIASGKTTAAHLMAGKKYPLFSADKIVSDLYKNKTFVALLIKKLKLNPEKKLKQQVKLMIKKNKKMIKKLESVVHPFVRKKMKDFMKNNNNIIILEIPLLIESKLNKFFDILVFVGAKKSTRLKRYLKTNKDKKLFNLLNKRQMPGHKKSLVCDHFINNEKSISILSKSVKEIINIYE